MIFLFTINLGVIYFVSSLRSCPAIGFNLLIKNWGNFQWKRSSMNSDKNRNQVKKSGLGIFVKISTFVFSNYVLNYKDSTIKKVEY
ncbi:hypothetical protein DB895_12230 [Flavobacterium psychrotolerans]|uniref:Uncharacterized protein n=1 Tax=Flavobacterium psychrotolerans TaxID=2169410 RepID=A0A2U1JGJ9_9FLAO|nr:hypothetical protein DB895_12230 [Flavobacterium psychrotolerans]